jgi:hypothetical protein
MPRRKNRPGFKRGRRSLPYWMASQILGKKAPPDFPDPCVPLPADASDDEIDTLCQGHTARLDKWLDDQKKSASDDDEPKARTSYDGRVLSASRIYQEHPLSAFNTRVKGNTRRSYLASLKVIETTVGQRLIRNLTVLDQQHWYDEWRKPAVFIDSEGNETRGPERIDRAHDAISMWKTVLRFNVALGPRHPGSKDCLLLLDALKNGGSLVNFERGGAREEEMTYAQASAFIRTALELGERGVMPKDRALYMAIGVAGQFDLALRQKDIIGERPMSARDQEKAMRRGATAISYGGVIWTGYFTWENIPGWCWRMKTSKSKYRSAANFDLTIYSLLFPLLEAVPRAERVGAVIKGEHGFAVQERSYRKWFRQIARAADIPDAVWNMDNRAGAGTEAEEAGADHDAIKTLLTHSEKQEATTNRYKRRQDQARVTVQQLREASRSKAGNAE